MVPKLYQKMAPLICVKAEATFAYGCVPRIGYGRVCRPRVPSRVVEVCVKTNVVRDRGVASAEPERAVRK